MAIERYGSKTDVVVKLVLVFFVCLLSFSIGTFVGKKFSDNQHKLAKFEPETSTHEVASTDSREHKEKTTMTDEEFAKLAEEFVADDASSTAKNDESKSERAPANKETEELPKDAHAKDSHGAAAKTKEHAAPAKDAHASAKDEHGAVKAAPMKVAEKLATGHKVEKKEESAKPTKATSLPPEVGTSAVGKYTVQIGSYPSEEEAKKRTEALKEQTFSAFYVEAKVKDKTWYRVGIGLFNTQKEAEAYMKDLLERKKVATAIVQKVQK